MIASLIVTTSLVVTVLDKPRMFDVDSIRGASLENVVITNQMKNGARGVEWVYVIDPSERAQLSKLASHGVQTLVNSRYGRTNGWKKEKGSIYGEAEIIEPDEPRPINIRSAAQQLANMPSSSEFNGRLVRAPDPRLRLRVIEFDNSNPAGIGSALTNTPSWFPSDLKRGKLDDLRFEMNNSLAGSRTVIANFHLIGDPQKIFEELNSRPEIWSPAPGFPTTNVGFAFVSRTQRRGVQLRPGFGKPDHYQILVRWELSGQDADSIDVEHSIYGNGMQSAF